MFFWVVVVAALGLVAIGCGYLAMTRVDMRWRAEHLQCCRCATRWFGRRQRGPVEPTTWTAVPAPRSAHRA